MKKIIIPVLSLLIIFTGNKITFPQSSAYGNLVKTVNTDGDETSCSFSGDRKTFVFARKQKNSGNYDIYVSQYSNGRWQTPVPITEINTDSDEVSPFISHDGKLLLFSSNRQESLKDAKAAKPSFDIYISEKEGTAWGTPYPIFGAVNTSGDELNPYMTADANTLYFTRSQFDDAGNSVIIETGRDNDIWGENMQTSDITYLSSIRISMVKKSVFHNGFWVSAYKESKRDIFFIAIDSDGNSEILDPGNTVNTENDENSVFEIDKNTIIISSDNNGISGSCDMAVKTIPDSFFPAGDTGKETKGKEYKTSDKTETDKKKDQADTGKEIGKHTGDKKKSDADKKKKSKKVVKDDIKETFVLEIVTQGLDNAGNIPLNVLFFDTLKSWSDPVESKTINTDESGKLLIEVAGNIKRIVVIPANDAIEGFAAEYIINKDGVMTGTLKLTKSSEKQFTFRSVYFGFNSSEIQLQDIPYLHELLEHLRKNSDMKISIEGYSDGYGSDRANMNISIKRAEKVRDYLVNRGIDSARIQVKGNGFKKKKAEDTSQECRRVDFLVIQ